MKGEKEKETRIKSQSKPKRLKKATEEMAEADGFADSMSVSIAAMHADIKALRVDVKTKLTTFRDSLAKDMKEEVCNF